MNYKFRNSAEALAFHGSLDPFRNPRAVAWQPYGWRMIRVSGILRDDSSISTERPRPRVETLGFDVIVPRNISVWNLQVAIQQHSFRLM